MTPSSDNRTGLELGAWEGLRSEAESIRYAVFVVEQGVPADVEVDAFDPVSVHAVLRDATGVAVATGRLLPDGHIGRMAVRHDGRGQGYGSSVLRALLDAAAARGHRTVVLSAQTHAIAFYTRHGFVAYGPEYLDCDIPHVDMRRDLLPDQNFNRSPT